MPSLPALHCVRGLSGCRLFSCRLFDRRLFDLGGLIGLSLSGALLLSGCGSSTDSDPSAGDGGMGGLGGEGGTGSGGASEEWDTWKKVELPGAVCADGSPYKFFVKRVQDSQGLGITLEPGGGCWDFDTCGGAGRARASYLEGLSDDHMTALPPPLGTKEDAIPWALMFPHLGEADLSVPTVDFDQVHLPYCTGDAYLGDLVVTYDASDGTDSIEVHHRGARNLELVRDYLSQEFPKPETLLVLGASAGALGASFHYTLLRDSVQPGRSVFVNDSGPVFVPGGPQSESRQAFAMRWQTDGLFRTLEERLGADEEESLLEDPGHLLSLLARSFPDDRFLVTYFLSDLNYSVFSYEGFYEDLSADRLFELWQQDTELLVEEIDKTDNWGYFLPGFRPDNCSHTVSLLATDELDNLSYVAQVVSGTANGYLRTDLGELDFGDALDSVLLQEDTPLRERADDALTDFTDRQVASCLSRVQ